MPPKKIASVLGASWSRLGASSGVLGRLGAVLGAFWGRLGGVFLASWGRLSFGVDFGFILKAILDHFGSFWPFKVIFGHFR